MPFVPRSALAQLTAALAGSLLLSPTSVAQPQASFSTHVYSANQESQTNTLYCGRQPITVQMLGNRMAVTLDGDTRLLTPTRAASGARYEAVGDADTVLWNKGELSTVTWSGQTLPTCAPLNALVVPFQAQGNEPFWQVRFDGWELSLHQPSGPVATMSGMITERTPQSLTLAGSGGAQPLQLQVTPDACVDTMSGMPYPQTARLQYGALTGMGCAGSPARLLQGGEWTLTRIGSAPLTAPLPSLSFLDDGRLAGMASCNRVMGGYAFSGEGLQLKELATTSMYCSDTQMQQEQQVLRALGSVRGLTLAGTDGVVFASSHGDIHAHWKPAAP